MKINIGGSYVALRNQTMKSNAPRHNDVRIRIEKNPLRILLSSCENQNTPEIQYSILCHIYSLILKGGRDTFSQLYKRFFGEYEEPLFIKKIKMKIWIKKAVYSFAKYSIIKFREPTLRVDSSL